MIKLITIVGARPQFIKAAVLNRVINTTFNNQIEEIIIHTGQHFDDKMSSIFFDELEIAPPKYNLAINGGSHAHQTSEMTLQIEKILLDEKPDGLVLYGDTNSTLAGALAASKIHVPVFHIEAGLRSFNKRMPEEINRIISDHVSSMLFCPTQTAVNNLQKEGYNIQRTISEVDYNNPGVFMVGDIMYDCALYFKEKSATEIDLSKNFGLNKNFILSTIHRPSNTDNLENLESIFTALIDISTANSVDIALPLHPRTKNAISKLPSNVQDKINHHIKILPPASYLEMIALQANASMIITDSGGVQKEAYFHQKPCITLRNETEWVELLDTNLFVLAGPDYKKIMNGFETLKNKTYKESDTGLYGKGDTAKKICELILEYLG